MYVCVCKNWIVVLKVKVSGEDQNFTESLCIYLLYLRSLGNQTRCADLLLLIIKPNTTKRAFAESRTLTYSIIRHTVRGNFAAQGDKPCLSCV